MNEIGCAVVGCGAVGPVHAEALSKSRRARFMATVDVAAERARDVAQKFGAECWYDDYRKVLEREDIDAVLICTPHYLHVPMIIDAAKHGKHVLVEKPLAIDSDSAAMALDACRRAGVCLAVCLQNRMNPVTVALRSAIDRGVLGKILCVTGEVCWYRSDEYYADSPWRGRWETEGGGVLINQAIHTLDLMLHLTGDVESVSATLATVGHSAIEVEDVASVSMRFVGGAIGNLFATTCSYPGSDVRIEVVGSKGSALIEADALARFSSINGETLVVEDDRYGSLMAKPYYGMSHRTLIEDFLEAVAENRPPYVTGEEGKRSIDVLDTIYREYRRQKASA
jgi:UDP-N-acetyl-2-amino-2-deoxyglucuronate dehydrogenase